MIVAGKESGDAGDLFMLGIVNGVSMGFILDKKRLVINMRLGDKTISRLLSFTAITDANFDIVMHEAKLMIKELKP